MPSRKSGTKANANSRGFSIRTQQASRYLAICLLLTLLAAAPAGATTVTGTIHRPDGTPVTGTIEFVLSQAAKTTTPPLLFAPVRTTCAVTNGVIAGGCTVQGNDTLDPAGTYYTVRVVDSNNRVVVPAANYTLAGASVDLGSLPVTATATLVPPSGNVVGNMNVTGNLSVGGTANISGVDLAASHLRLLGLTADPATATDGSIFHRSDLNRIRIRAQGLQLFDGTGFIDINSSQPNTVDIGGNLKVGGATQLGSSADISCNSTDPASPSTDSNRLYCLTGDKRLYLKNDTGTIFGPLAALNQPQTWTAAQTVAEMNNIRYANGFTGADGGAKIQACLAALPSPGGTCDARGLESAQVISSTITIGENETVLLGAAVFTVTGYPAFDLNGHGAKLIGLGPGDTTQASGAGGLTVLRASSPTATSDMVFVGTPTGPGIVRNPEVSGIKIDFNNEATGAGRHGVYIQNAQIGKFHDIAVYNAGGDCFRIEPFDSFGAAYFNTFERTLAKQCIGAQYHLLATGEIRYTTFINAQGNGHKADETTVGAHGWHLEVPAGAEPGTVNSINDTNCIGCSVSGVADGNHGVFLQQMGTIGQIGTFSYTGLVETKVGQTGTGLFVSSEMVNGIFKITYDAGASGFASTHNVTAANVSQFLLKSGATSWQQSSLEFGERSGTLNEIRFRTVGGGIFGLSADASGIVARRVDTSANIWRTDAIGLYPLTANTFSSGRSAFRWSNVFSVLGDFSSTLTAAGFVSSSADPADAGVLRLANAELICWEASPAGTDVCITVDTNEIFQLTGGTLDGADLTAGSITAAQMAAGFIDAATDFAGTLCGTNQILEDQGASWACINTPTGSGYATIEDEDIALTQRATLNFEGAGVSCADDTTKTTCTISGGGGSGDAIEVEDGDNAGTFTVIDTTARFDDSGDINFIFADGGAGGPDVITATVRPDSVALGADTTGNYVDNVTGGAGIAVTHTPGEGSDPSVAVDLLALEDNVGATSNNSGLEFGGAGSDKLALLQGCSDGQLLKWTNTGGTWDCASDISGGTPAWETLLNSGSTATTYASTTTTQTFTETFSAAFTAGTQHKIAGTGAFTGGVLFGVEQATGNPTGGTLGQFLGADANINALRVKNTASADTTHWDFYSGEDSTSFSTTPLSYLGFSYNAIATLNKATASRDSAFLVVNEDNTTNSHKALGAAAFANHPSGTKAFVPAIGADSYSLGAGDTTSLIGVTTYVEQAGSGAVAGAFGIYVGSNADSGAGSITNNYGLFIDAQTAGATGNWAIKTEGTARSQFGGPVDTDTGYRISNAATTGNYLRGNGANFVSSAIQAGDLGSGYIDGLADFAAALCGTNELLLDGGGSWSCLATTGSGSGVRATSPTNVALNVEDTGNVITTVSKLTLLAAGCNNATAGPGFDLPTSNAPAPACLGTSPHSLGSLDFSDGATQTAVTHFRLPGDWTGSVDVAFLFTGDTASSNNIRWQVSSACVADSEDLLNPTYNSASASNTAGPSTVGQRRSISFSSVSMSTCAAGETAFWKFERVGGDAGDTYTGLARLLEVEITLRRAQ